MTPVSTKAANQIKHPDQFGPFMLVESDGATAGYHDDKTGRTLGTTVSDGVAVTPTMPGLVGAQTFGGGKVLCGKTGGNTTCYALLGGTSSVSVMVAGPVTAAEAAQITLDYASKL